MKNSKLFIISFAMLFAEIALIRWISTEVRIFAYVNNLVLLACFLGIGLGCYLSKKKSHISITAGGLSILILLISMPLFIRFEGSYVHLFKNIPLLLSAFTDSIVWFEPKVNSIFFATLLGTLATLVIFFITFFIFVPLGQLLGRTLNEHKNPITAYSVNVMASILGVWCFSALSFVYSWPANWFGIIALLLLILVLFQHLRSRLSDIVSILVFVLAIFFCMIFYSKFQDIGLIVWSPYQKLEVKRLLVKKQNVERGYILMVNNVGYMTLFDLSDSFIKKHSDYFQGAQRAFGQYDIPFMFKKDAKDVLILGAGAGNDAAGALHNNVKSVDAVEIDPGIYVLGAKFHPERPYSDPRVNVIIDDARSFFKKATKKYDLIVFGLLDSHTLTSNYNNTRIDHYVYTKESFREAKELLKDDGVMTVVFEPQRFWIGWRIYALLRDVFGTPPLAISVGSNGLFGLGGSMFITGKDPSIISDTINNNVGLQQFISEKKIAFFETLPSEYQVRLTTDDWPYLYLEKPNIPKMHLSIMAILLLLLIVAKKAMLPKGLNLNFHFFFLGAAFLLLEFQNISKTTLLFGSTWLVNTFTISAILILILLANLFVSIVKIQSFKPIYILLLLSLAISYIIPLRVFNIFGYWQKSIIASVILNLPIFFAGIIFISSFKKTESRDLAFGSNFIGAAFGGLLESLAFIFGINALLLIVVAFYVLSFIFINRN